MCVCGCVCIDVDLLDTTGTLYSMAKFSGVLDPVTLDFDNSTAAYMVDAFSISMGSLMGTSPVTAFIESATGIAEGGRTGITGITAGLCFFVSLFFAPIFASIPSWATGGALVIAGSLMMQNAALINWGYLGDAIPAFLTIVVIPLTYNIAYGLIAGIGAMVLLKVIPNLLYRLSGGTIVPDNYEYAEHWTVPPGGVMPLWLCVPFLPSFLPLLSASCQLPFQVSETDCTNLGTMTYRRRTMRREPFWRDVEDCEGGGVLGLDRVHDGQRTAEMDGTPDTYRAYGGSEEEDYRSMSRMGEKTSSAAASEIVSPDHRPEDAEDGYDYGEDARPYEEGDEDDRSRTVDEDDFGEDDEDDGDGDEDEDEDDDEDDDGDGDEDEDEDEDDDDDDDEDKSSLAHGGAEANIIPVSSVPTPETEPEDRHGVEQSVQRPSYTPAG